MGNVLLHAPEWLLRLLGNLPYCRPTTEPLNRSMYVVTFAMLVLAIVPRLAVLEWLALHNNGIGKWKDHCVVLWVSWLLPCILPA